MRLTAVRDVGGHTQAGLAFCMDSPRGYDRPNNRGRRYGSRNTRAKYPAKARSSWIFGGALGLTAILAIVVVVIIGGRRGRTRPSPRPVMERFLTASQKADTDGMLVCMTKRCSVGLGAQKTDPSGQFASKVALGLIAKTFETAKIGALSVRGSQASIRVEGVQDAFSPTIADFNFTLVLEQGKWKIDDFQLIEGTERGPR